MCIIVAKPENICVPSRETFKNCFQNNKDGAGIMYAYKGAVHITKGLMTLDEFNKELDMLSKKFNLDNLAMVFHFRIGTQGRNDRANTHPFPISEDIEHLTAQRFVCNVAVAHNGIIGITRSYYSADYSDTVLFVRDYLSCLIEKPIFYKNPKMLKVIERLAGSKLAFLSNDGHITTIGAFTTEEGVLYSNSTYSYARVTYNYTNGVYSNNNYTGYGSGYAYDEENGYYKRTTVPASQTKAGSANGSTNISGTIFKYLTLIKDEDDLYLMDENFETVDIVPNKYYLDTDGKVYGFSPISEMWCVIVGLKLYDRDSNVVLGKADYKTDSFLKINPNTQYNSLSYKKMISTKGADIV